METQTDQERVEALLRATNRSGVEKLITWLEKKSYFTAPASVCFHNHVDGGLAHHSLQVYDLAMRLRSEWIAEGKATAEELPEDGVTLSTLLHDVCKHDVYFMKDGEPQCDKEKRKLGHGRRSMMLLIKTIGFPLNYNEMMAIWWHMGNEHEPSYQYYKSEYKESETIPLCVLIRKADHDATH